MCIERTTGNVINVKHREWSSSCGLLGRGDLGMLPGGSSMWTGPSRMNGIYLEMVTIAYIYVYTYKVM